MLEKKLQYKYLKYKFKYNNFKSNMEGGVGVNRWTKFNHEMRDPKQELETTSDENINPNQELETTSDGSDGSG